MAREKSSTPVVSYDQPCMSIMTFADDSQKFTCLSANRNWVNPPNSATQRRLHAGQYMARLDRQYFPNGRLTPPRWRPSPAGVGGWGRGSGASATIGSDTP